MAVKKFKKSYDDEHRALSTTEIKNLRTLKHPNIIELKSVAFHDSRLYIVTEFLDCNLTDFVKAYKKKKGTRLPENAIAEIMKQILESLNYLHSQGFMHRDIKPENFVIQESTGLVKMIDFGTSRDFKDSKGPFSSYVSTRWYRAPEQVLRSQHYGPQIDIFAAGCIMAEIYNLEPLFPGASELD